MSQTCHTCKTTDNEYHRLNECSVYDHLNYAKSLTKCDFNNVYNDDTEILNPIITQIESVWEFRYANGRRRKV